MLKRTKKLVLISLLIPNLFYFNASFAFQKRSRKLTANNNISELPNYQKKTDITALQDGYAVLKKHTADSASKSLRNNIFSSFRYSFGIGLVTAPLKNNFQTSLQVDFYNKEDVHLGIIIGYANKTTIWNNSNRTALMLNYQYDLRDWKSKNNWYFNLGLGVGYFSDAYTFSFMGESPQKSFFYAPVGHIGFGYMYTVSKKWGMFTEIGFGGPHSLNVGLFF